MPTKGYFMKTLDDSYSKMKKKLTDVLAKQEVVCVTCDVWSSRAQSYIGMSVHYLTPDYERKSYVLAFRQLTGRQTNEELSLEMNKMFNEFGLDKYKITHVVTDGCSSFTKGFRLYGKSDPLTESIDIEELEAEQDDTIDDVNDQNEMPFMQNEQGELLVSNILTFGDTDENSDIDDEHEYFEGMGNELNVEQNDILQDLIFESNDNHVTERRKEIELPAQRRCISHLLNLVSSDFEKALTSTAKTALISAFNKLHALWVFTHRSSNANSICKTVLGCKLKVPCVTRWNSKFDAVSLALRADIQPKINILIERIVTEIPKATNIRKLLPTDFAILQEYIKVMKPVAASLDRLQGDKTMSQGFITPTLRSMKHHISSVQGGTLLELFKGALLGVIEKRFERHMEISERNQELILAASSNPIFKINFAPPLDQLRVREMFKQECKRLSNENEIETNIGNEVDNSNEDDFFLSYARSSSARRFSIDNTIDAEVDRFCEDSRKDFKILDEYPNIKNVFARHNTTLSASGVIERTFNFAKMIHRPQRNRISAENFEKTLLLKLNYSLLNDESS